MSGYFELKWDEEVSTLKAVQRVTGMYSHPDEAMVTLIAHWIKKRALPFSSPMLSSFQKVPRELSRVSSLAYTIRPKHSYKADLENGCYESSTIAEWYGYAIELLKNKMMLSDEDREMFCFKQVTKCLDVDSYLTSPERVLLQLCTDEKALGRSNVGIGTAARIISELDDSWELLKKEILEESCTGTKGYGPKLEILEGLIRKMVNWMKAPSGIEKAKAVESLHMVMSFLHEQTTSIVASALWRLYYHSPQEFY
uniref:Uncharacterized protein n=1 Tax=Photinus pyralis TaxID=7054 RepID=A0A1Y1KN18_PHOPY